MKENISTAIEAILFATAEPQTYAFLASTIGVEIEEITKAVEDLSAHYKDRGMVITALNEVVTLVTASNYSPLIETLRKNELSKDLSKASAETLAVVAYASGITKSEIEFVRGVNATFSLRSLLMRGLIEQKGKVYQPTLELLHHFGVAALTELPEYATAHAKIAALITNTNTASGQKE